MEPLETGVHVKLLRIEEVAAALGMSFQAVRSAIAAGDLAAVKVGARGVRVREEEVAKLICRGSRERFSGRHPKRVSK
jgi:excisionase family DNA binding protein